MAPDEVLCQRGAVRVHHGKLARRQEAGLHQRLEAVADAADQAFPGADQLVDGVHHRPAAQEGGDELAGAVRLIAAGEAAGDKEHLGGCDRVRQLADALRHRITCQVADEEDLGVSARFLESARAVHLAVGAGEGGDDDPGLGDVYALGCPLLGLGDGRWLALVRCANGVHALQLAVIRQEQFIKQHLFILPCDGRCLLRIAQQGADLRVLRHLQNEGTVIVREQFVLCYARVNFHADVVANRHLG